MHIQGLQGISEIFSIFHDGIVSRYEVEGADLLLTVEISYLAERVAPTYTKFFVRLAGTAELRFSTWPSDLESEPQQIVEAGEIFHPDLDILESSVKNEHIEVACNQTSEEYDYCGGTLSFRADTATVTDEAGKAYSVEELDQLCKAYWDDWARKNQT